MTTNSKAAINHVMKAIPFEPHVHHRRRRNEFLSQFASRKCFVTSRTQCYIWGGQRRVLSDWPVQSGISLVNLLEARENECRFVIHRFKVDKLQFIVVAKNITVLQLFISRMPKMCAIPQLVSAPLNPIPIVEHFRRSHPQCEHSYGQHIYMGEENNAK